MLTDMSFLLTPGAAKITAFKLQEIQGRLAPTLAWCCCVVLQRLALLWSRVIRYAVGVES